MKKCKRYSFLLVFTMCLISAFSFLKSSAVSSQKNEVRTNPNKEYQITYELNGGRFEGEYPKTFKISQETAIPNPIKDGSEFLGWTINDVSNLAPIKDYKIPAMTQMDIKLTANWKMKGNMLLDGQSFNSTIKRMDNFASVKEIKFVYGTPNPNGTNVSDGSIKAHIEGTVLTVACEKEIYANPDCYKMFDSLSNITKITFDNFNTSQVKRFENIFANCQLLDSIEGIDKWDTSQVTNMNYMFFNCRSLQNIDLSSWDTSKATSMSRMFDNCRNLRGSITIKNPSCNEYSLMFYGTSLEKSSRFIVKYISPETKEVARQMVETKGYGNVYLYEEASTLVDGQTFNNKIKSLSSFTNVSKVIFDYGIPSNISSYPNVDVSGNGSIIAYVDSDTLYVVSNGDIIANPTISHLFRYCYNLVSIDFTNNFKTDDVTQMNSMFESSNRLTEIKGLEKFNTINVKDMSGMFFGCSNLKTANTTNFNTSQVTNMSYMFKDCNNLSGEITISNLNTNYYREMFISCSTANRTQFVVKYTTPDIKEIARRMVETKSTKSNVYLDGELPTILVDGNTFNKTISSMPNFANVTEIQFLSGTPNPDGVDVARLGKIKAYINGNVLTVASEGEIFANPDSSSIFKDLSNITNINLSNFNTSKVTDMSFMFSMCNSLSQIVGVESFNTSQVTNINYMFDNVIVPSLDLNSWDTSKVTSMRGVFVQSKVKDLKLNNWNTSQVTTMTQLFNQAKCLSLDLSGWDTSKVTDMSHMFSYVEVKEVVGLENFNVSQVTNMSYMFKSCDNISFNLNKWDISKVENMDCMFSWCRNLSGEVTIMNSNVTKYKEIFEACSDLGGRFVVNYTWNCRSIAQDMLSTKSLYSNVVLGSQKSLLNEDIPNDEEPSTPSTVMLTIKDGNKSTMKEILAGEIGSLNVPSKEGMIFSGYFYDIEYTKPVSERDVISKDTTIYIKWEEIPQEETEIPQDENKDENLEIA